MAIRLLIIDDSNADRLLLRRQLQQTSLDLEIREAASIGSGLDLIQSEPVDCLLLDYRLTDGDGLTFMESLASRLDIGLLPIVMLTGEGSQTVATQALKRGADDFLSKDHVTPATLEQRLSYAIDLCAMRRARNEAEAALAESEAHFRDLVEGSVQGMVIARNGSPVFANQSFASMFGYDSPEQIVNLPSLDVLYTPSDLMRLKGYRMAWHRGQAAPTDYTFQGVRRDGAMIDVEVRVRLVIWQGEPAVQSTTIDITDRRQAEDSLRLRTAAAEAATDGILIVDARAPDLPIIYASRGFLTTTGYGQDEVLGRNCRFLQGPETDPADVKQLKQALSAGLPFAGELLNYRKNGEAFWNLLRIEPLTDAAGQPQYFVGTQTDITARKDMEQSLFKEKERLQVTLHSIGDGVVTTDAQGQIEFMNPIAETLTGWLIGDARGRPLEQVFQIVHEDTGERVPNPVTECIKKNAVVGLESRTVLISRGGDRYGIQDSAAPIRTTTGETLGAVLVFQDVTEARGLARQVEYQASHDALTGLLNRREFEQRLNRALFTAQKESKQHTLCYLDLDNFKIVNDTAGHVAGDALLKQISHVLGAKLRTRDSLARLGGDEFSVLLESCPFDKACDIAEELVRTIRGLRFTWDSHVYDIGVSIGIVPVTADVQSVAQLLTQADVVCYAAKGQGRNRVVAYNADDGESARRHREMLRAAGLRNALDRGRFSLHAQRIMPLSDAGAEVHYELLLRLQDESGALLLPGAFIPAAERYHLMGAIDRWVIETALSQYDLSFGRGSNAGVTINLSGNSLTDDGLLELICQRMTRHGVPPERICFEITETAAISNLDQASRLIHELKARGCRFALDDFGSGLSSFNYLKQFPVDYLKIDGSFVRGIVSDRIDRAMVESINHIGHEMGIQTIAESVENQDVLDLLKTIGVDYAQGFAVAKPTPLSAIAPVASATGPISPMALVGN